MNIPIKRFDKTIPLPTYENGAGCFDLICNRPCVIEPKQIAIVSLNVAVQIPKGYVIFLFVRSSTPIKKGIILANSVGIVDSFYNGDTDELVAEFLNITNKTVNIKRGEYLVQGMLIKSESVKWVEREKFKNKGRGGYKI